MTARGNFRREMTPLDEQIERVEAAIDAKAEAIARKHARTVTPPAAAPVIPDLPVILDFENRHPNHNGTKEGAIITELHLTAARYYQLLNRHIDTPEALQHDPILTHRLLDARARRIQARTTRSLTR